MVTIIIDWNPLLIFSFCKSKKKLLLFNELTVLTWAPCMFITVDGMRWAGILLNHEPEEILCHFCQLFLLQQSKIM